jgi:hypothetical protein
MKRVIFFIMGIILVQCAIVSAGVPKQFSFQGILKDTTDNPIEDDIYAIKFTIYDDSVSGSALWETAGFVPIQTYKGLFQHVLGSTNPIPDSIAEFDNLWVGIKVNLEPEMMPRTRLASVPFSLSAQYADTASFSRTAQFAVQANASIYADTAQFAIHANTSTYADTAAYAHVPLTYRRIAYDLDADSTQNMNYEQVGNTLVINPGEVSSYIIVVLLRGAFVEGHYDCYTDIRIGIAGAEISKDVKPIFNSSSSAANVDIINTLQFYYEPTTEEQTNGFNVEIFMKTTWQYDWARYYRCEVFGI